ncbi:FAD-dependent oxidoreductase [Roseovarius faecimaris]|uniref:Tryptophan 2-monooxygenase n=1 Tax=Roseovarius faecimaris TaxID=2494550 RepID=A0A6I6IVT5_9RHOB|nr:NAD(P)/FAD-dependent oxidoreductase [Roseovarius faecimaris]QGX99526.1 FAD-dependent oxidoreductase [Roseovarius faecimaris]
MINSAHTGTNGAYDVIVIGAGAAGLAATRKLSSAGVSVICLEASGRIGGRAHTDHQIFGIPFDRGAHWLHDFKRNAYARIGRKLGFDLYKVPEHYLLHGAEDPDPIWDMFDAMGDHLSAVAQSSEDKPLSEALDLFPCDDPWARTARFMQCFPNAQDETALSLHDWYNYEDGPDWFCKQGFGAIVAAFGDGLPVRLNTPVTAIARTAAGVEVTSSAGTARARAVIVTVSQGVLAAEAIRFDPPLGNARLSAIDGIRMGHYNHNVLHLAPGALPVRPDTWITYRITEEKHGAPQGGGFLCDVSGSGLTYFETSGSFARDLEAAGEKAALAYATDTLADLFGAEIRKAVIKGHATTYGRDPLFRGSYSGARPGAAAQRKTLRQPHADRIHFAGEATHLSQMATVSGAHKSGRRAAKAVLAQLHGPDQVS